MSCPLLAFSGLDKSKIDLSRTENGNQGRVGCCSLLVFSDLDESWTCGEQETTTKDNVFTVVLYCSLLSLIRRPQQRTTVRTLSLVAVSCSPWTHLDQKTATKDNELAVVHLLDNSQLIVLC